MLEIEAQKFRVIFLTRNILLLKHYVRKGIRSFRTWKQNTKSKNRTKSNGTLPKQYARKGIRSFTSQSSPTKTY